MGTITSSRSAVSPLSTSDKPLNKKQRRALAKAEAIKEGETKTTTPEEALKQIEEFRAKEGVKAETAKPAKTPKAPSNRISIRLRVFDLLNANAGGLTGKEVMVKLGLKGIPATLKDEGISAKPRIQREKKNGKRGVVYALTAAGKADLKAGKVDDNAAPRSVGLTW